MAHCGAQLFTQGAVAQPVSAWLTWTSRDHAKNEALPTYSEGQRPTLGVHAQVEGVLGLDAHQTNV